MQAQILSRMVQVDGISHAIAASTNKSTHEGESVQVTELFYNCTFVVLVSMLLVRSEALLEEIHDIARVRVCS